MTKMKHWLITRFNLGLYRLNKDPDSWFWQRVAIFKKITAPSLARQTSKNFVLMVLIDAETPQTHIDTIQSVLSHSNFESVIIKIALPYDWHPKKYGERQATLIDYRPILEHMAPLSKYVVQTRLDNDDALLPDAIAIIQRAVVSVKQSYAIDSSKGFAIDTINEKAYAIKHKAGGTPFISLVQAIGKKTRTIYEVIHQRLYAQYEVIDVATPFWVMNVHGGNVSNRIFEEMVCGEIDYYKMIKSIL